jgi:GT2 family glycosyltransferase
MQSDTLAVMPTFVRSRDDLDITMNAIESLHATSDAEILVVDDCSPNEKLREELADFVAGQSLSINLKARNEGFSKTVNYGLRQALERGQHGLLVNADIQFFNNRWLDIMRSNDADVVGALLLYPNGLVQHAGIFFSVITRIFDHIHRMAPSTLDLVDRPRICPVTGALQLIKHRTLETIGLYDENFKMGWEDVDYCHMVFKAGMKCAYEPRAIAIHYESLFRNRDPPRHIQEWTTQSLEYLYEKHKGHGFSEYVPSMIWPDEI